MITRNLLAPLAEELLPRLPVKVRVLDERLVGAMPDYQSPDAAALDLKAAIAEPLVIQPGELARIPTGLAAWLEHAGFVALIFPRSGLGTKGLVLANTVGVIDPDYQGEIVVMARNLGAEPITIEPLMRVAQLLVTSVQRIAWQVVEDFPEATARGEGGFGSTGTGA